MTEKIKLLLVDDQRLMRDGLRTMLELEDDLVVAAEAENGRVALEQYQAVQPDVVLMDIRMPEMDGVEATSQLNTKYDNPRVIILTTFDDDQYIFDGLRAGALGYMLKDVSGEELANAIRTVYKGGALIEPSVARKVISEFSRLPGTVSPVAPRLDPLTEREIEILALVAEGLTNREIAQKLFLAEGTVKNYITNILNKLNARDRTQAVVKAKEAGLI